MAVYPYQLADGTTRWSYILDLPPDVDGRRRQRKKRGFTSERAAVKAERGARNTYSHVAWPPTAASPLNRRRG